MLRVSLESDEAMLAIATSSGGTVSTSVYRLKKFKLDGGKFTAGTMTSVIEIDSEMKRAYRTGWGQGRIVERRRGAPERRMQVHFFYDVGRSAHDRPVQTNEGVWVPSSTLVGESAWLAELVRVHQTAQLTGERCLKDGGVNHP
jgi:hypothetical protein